MIHAWTGFLKNDQCSFQVAPKIMHGRSGCSQNDRSWYHVAFEMIHGCARLPTNLPLSTPFSNPVSTQPCTAYTWRQSAWKAQAKKQQQKANAAKCLRQVDAWRSKRFRKVCMEIIEKWIHFGGNLIIYCRLHYVGNQEHSTEKVDHLAGHIVRNMWNVTTEHLEFYCFEWGWVAIFKLGPPWNWKQFGTTMNLIGGD